MSEHKHTPGPWFIQEGKYYACVRTDERVIADMRTVGNVVPNMNDARLIAASPELLEALQKAVARQGFSNEELIDARAAIAKATGATE